MTSPYSLDVADDTFVVADPAVVARVVADPASFRRWWPDLRPVHTWERGLEGVRWQVSGAVSGSMEIWLEPYADGVVVHYYLRADPVVGDGPARRPARGRRERERRSREWKRHAHALKDRLEAGREPGQARRPPVSRPPVSGTPVSRTPVKERGQPADCP